MRRQALIVIAILAAALSLSGCDKTRRTQPNPSGPAGCLGCHGGVSGDPSGAPPNDLAGSQTGGAVGAHTAHLSRQVRCEECHRVPGRIVEPGHIVKPDGTPDGDGRAEVVFGPRASSGNVIGSFTPAPAPGKGGTCSVYCHGVSLGAAGGSSSGASSGNVIAPSPTWGSTGFTCGSCHGDATVNPSSPNTTGAPPTHAPGLAPTACASCHPDTVAADGQLTTSGAHINGQVEASGCTSCHGNATRGETSTQASWAPPVDSTNAIAGAKVGAHLRHVSTVATLGSRISRPFACSECHRVPTNGGPHGQPVIQWATGTNNLVNTGGLNPVYSAATGSCASTYCHGASLTGGSNRTPGWNTTGAGACGSCHFLSSPAAPHPATDKVGVAITAPTQCAQCHPGTVNASGTINTVNGLHVNGVVEFDFHPAGYSNPVVHGPDALRNLADPAACKSCHGPAFAGQGAAPSCTACHAVTGHATWLSECTFCHGQGNRAADAAFARVGSPVAGANILANQAAPPVGTQGELGANQPAVGAHLAHIDPASSLNGALAIQIQCTECHGASLPTDAGHADGSVAIGWGSLARARSAVPAPAAGNLLASWESNPTCTNYCHGITLAGGGSKVNPNWVAGAPEAACGTCHSAVRPGTWHPANTTCGQCHPGYTSSTVNLATHVNGAIDPAATTCFSCHGGLSGNAAPPLATTGATTGVKVGAHQAHNNAGTLTSTGYGCAICHVSPGALRHGNDQVDMNWTGRAVTGGVVPTPAAGTLPVGAWETTPTCTNYCHGASLTAAGGGNRTPDWTAGVSQVACGTCHGSPPPLAAAPAGADHPQNAACATCHGAGYAQAAVTGAALAIHVNGTVNLLVTGCTRCHGELGASGVTLAANLVKAGPGASGSGTNSFDTTGQTAATSAGVGAHEAHLVGTAGMPRWRTAALLCTECHALPPSDTDTTHATGVGTGGARATLSWGPLANSAVLGARTPSYAQPTCASTYCHAPKADTAATAMAPAWTGGAAAATCGSCHGLPPVTANHPTGAANCGGCHTGYADAPTAASTITAVSAANHLDGKVDLSGSTSCSTCHGTTARVAVASATVNDSLGNPLVKAAPPVSTSINQPGAHLAHLNQGATPPALSNAQQCTACHVVPTSVGHSDGTAIITFGDIANTGGATPSYDLVGHSCSSTYCHGQFTGGRSGNTVNWGTGTPAKLTCADCHGQSVANPQPAHPHPQNLTCATCHAGYSTTTVAAATHVDGAVTKSTAGCTACHGELPAAGVTLTNNTIAAAPGATGTNTVDTAGQLAATAAGVGAHRAHLAVRVIGGVAIACSECHALPPSNGDTGHATSGAGSGGARATLTWGATATRSVNAWSGAPVVPAYTSSTSGAGGTTGGNCASTYCHGNFTSGKNASVAWTSTVDMTCNSCHGAAAATVTVASLPVAPHPQGNATCSLCHSGYDGTTASATLHLNGRLDVVAQTCTSCHGASGRTPVATATDLDALGANLAKAAPPADSTGAATGNQVGAHLAHVNQGATAPAMSNALRCVNCHTGLVWTTAPHATPANPVAFGNLATAAGAAPSAYAPAIRDCSNTYCHGQFTGGKLANTVNWGTGTLAKLSCFACHGVSAAAPQPAHPHPQNTTCADCHTGYSTTTVAAATHVDGAVTKSTSGCTACHGDRADTAVTLTVNTNKASPMGAANTATSADTTGQTATTAAGVGAHEAHLVGNSATNGPRWSDTAITCIECHAPPPNDTDTTHATGVGTGGARANVIWGTLATGAVNSWSGAPVSPSYAGSNTFAGGTTGGTCASTYCHGNFTNGTNATPSWTGASSTVVCGSCHGLPPAGSHPADTACGTCHPGFTNAPGAGSTIAQVNALAHINGLLDGSFDCVGCHNGTQGTRRAIVPEFKNVWSHKRSSSGGVPANTVVTNFDCAVCHMEGDPATGNRTAFHQGTAGGAINLRDPDLGTEITNVAFTAAPAGQSTNAGSYAPAAGSPAFTQFSRNLGSTTLEPAVQAIMINQCLKCHDAGGAGSTLARVPGGTAGKPFNTNIFGTGYNGGTGLTACAAGTNGCVTNVADSFAPGNSSYHPVLGQQNNWYSKLTRMAPPWNAATVSRGATANATSWGWRISCWDCHAGTGAAGTLTMTVTAHGGATTLRGNATTAGTPVANTNEATLCKVCHAGYTTSTLENHGTNSAFTSGTDGGMIAFLRYGCNACHSSLYATTVAAGAVRPVRAQDVHGVNVLPTAGTKSGRWAGTSTGTPAQVEARPYAFIRNTTTLANHQPVRIGGSTYGPSCSTPGTRYTSCNDGMGGYTVGGTY